MSKRTHFTPELKVAIVRRHLLRGSRSPTCPPHWASTPRKTATGRSSSSRTRRRPSSGGRTRPTSGDQWPLPSGRTPSFRPSAIRRTRSWRICWRSTSRKEGDVGNPKRRLDSPRNARHGSRLRPQLDRPGRDAGQTVPRLDGRSRGDALQVAKTVRPGQRVQRLDPSRPLPGRLGEAGAWAEQVRLPRVPASRCFSACIG